MITIPRLPFIWCLLATALVSLPAQAQRDADLHVKKQQLTKIKNQVATQTAAWLVQEGDINITLSDAFLAKTTALLGDRPQAARTTRLTLDRTEGSLYQNPSGPIETRLDQLFGELTLGKPTLQPKQNALNLTLPLTLSAQINATVLIAGQPRMASGKVTIEAAPPLKLVPTPQKNETYGFALLTDGPQSLTGTLALEAQDIGSFSTEVSLPLPEEPLTELRLPGLIAKQVSLDFGAPDKTVKRTWLIDTALFPIVFKPSGISIAVSVDLKEITPSATSQ